MGQTLRCLTGLTTQPSASEATTKDYPSYVGSYTDNKSTEQSTNPLKYTWKILKKVKEYI